MTIKRGNIYLVSLDPTMGSEINKLRPVIVVSNDTSNTYSNTITVLPVTSNTDRVFPFEVIITEGEGNLPKKSKAKADQIRTLDKSRIIKFIDVLESETMNQIEQAIKIHLAIN
jgi:mRNA interferase MazF